MNQTLNPQTLKIISGGQTGADRAALDWAIAQGIPHGGDCPSGRLAENGLFLIVTTPGMIHR